MCVNKIPVIIGSNVMAPMSLVFGITMRIPPMSSTKSITGHSLGAVSAQEAVFCLLMMENSFMAESANIENLDEKAKDMPILRKVEKKELNCVMSNSFGFGGTNSTLVFEKI